MENELLRKCVVEHIIVAGNMLADSHVRSNIDIAASLILKSLKHGGKVIICGNGGSAADAQHMAAEFVGRYLKERKALPAIALTVNTSALTAIGNDYGFDRLFSRQVAALVGKNDVVIGISTSGNSLNVAYALEMARELDVATIALVGAKRGRMNADIIINVPSESTPRIQEMHILIIHMICEMVENGVLK
jgi:D-sedoheptulose 7-phosphate isomerase